MAGEKLLNVEPQEISFRFEVGRQASCTIRLSNNSGKHVAFKVMTTTPDKYRVRPNNGILLPGSSFDVEVTMAAPNKAPSDMQCNDKFLIKSAVASPWHTVNQSQKLFNENGRRYMDGDWRLRVVFVHPSHQQSSNFGRPGESSSLNGSMVQESSLSDTEDWNRGNVGDLFMKSITIVFLCLIFWCLIMKMLPLIWSLTFVTAVFVIKMAKRMVSDSIEDWIGKTILYLCIHYFSSFFRRGERRRGR